jgi:uncharacterized protein (DUF2062 family)
MLSNILGLLVMALVMFVVNYSAQRFLQKRTAVKARNDAPL